MGETASHCCGMGKKPWKHRLQSASMLESVRGRRMLWCTSACFEPESCRDVRSKLHAAQEGKLLAGLQLAHCINALATQHPEVGTVEVQFVRSIKVHVGGLWWGALCIVRSPGQYCNRSAASGFVVTEFGACVVLCRYCL